MALAKANIKIYKEVPTFSTSTGLCRIIGSKNRRGELLRSVHVRRASSSRRHRAPLDCERHFVYGFLQAERWWRYIYYCLSA